MEDFRFNVKISIVGCNNKVKQLDWYGYWQPNVANKLRDAIQEIVEEVGLECDDYDVDWAD